jgi:hypothetical protein
MVCTVVSPLEEIGAGFGDWVRLWFSEELHPMIATNPTDIKKNSIALPA